MPGQLDDLKSRKRKSSPEVRVSSTKVSTSGRNHLKSPKQHSADECSSAVTPGQTSDDETSRISCECHVTEDRRRCSASPGFEGQEGKENNPRTEQEINSCCANDAWDKQGSDSMDCDERDKNLFPDEDSNQILPVEQFFGNLDIVQDFPQRSPATSPSARRKERRRHFYARDDSDEEARHQDDGTGT